MSKDLNNTNKATTIETKRLWLVTVKAPQSGVGLSSCCELVNELTHSHQSMVLCTTCHHFQYYLWPSKKSINISPYQMKLDNYRIIKQLLINLHHSLIMV